MFNAAQLVERVPLRYSFLTLFYRFRENFEFTSRIIDQNLKTQQHPNSKSPVICW